MWCAALQGWQEPRTLQHPPGHANPTTHVHSHQGTSPVTTFSKVKRVNKRRVFWILWSYTPSTFCMLEKSGLWYVLTDGNGWYVLTDVSLGSVPCNYACCGPLVLVCTTDCKTDDASRKPATESECLNSWGSWIFLVDTVVCIAWPTFFSTLLRHEQLTFCKQAWIMCSCMQTAAPAV